MQSTIVGTVKEKRVRIGTGSEHNAIVLVRDDNTEVIIKERTGNQFEINDEQRALIGKRVEVSGFFVKPTELRYDTITLV